jgi:hypothetical protein
VRKQQRQSGRIRLEGTAAGVTCVWLCNMGVGLSCRQDAQHNAVDFMSCRSIRHAYAARWRCYTA